MVVYIHHRVHYYRVFYCNRGILRLHHSNVEMTINHATIGVNKLQHLKVDLMFNVLRFITSLII